MDNTLMVRSLNNSKVTEEERSLVSRANVSVEYA